MFLKHILKNNIISKKQFSINQIKFFSTGSTPKAEGSRSLSSQFQEIYSKELEKLNSAK